MSNKFRHHNEFSAEFSIENTSDGRIVFFEGKAILTLTSPENLLNKFKGKCYILTSGPSLNHFDDSLLESGSVVYVNGSIKRYYEKKLNAFYVADDADFFENRMNDILSGLEKVDICFFSALGLDFICRHDVNALANKKVVLLERINRYYNRPIRPKHIFGLKNMFDSDFKYGSYNPFSNQFGRVGFSRNLQKGIFGGRTIAYHALQVAYHLGYRDIAIAGMDLSQGTAARFYESNKNSRPTSLSKHYERHILPSFQVITKLVKKGGLSVINLSKNSRLPSEVIEKREQY